jgi:hypothetical protein
MLGGNLLTRSGILAHEDLPKRLVNVPEWGGQIYVRTLTGKERDFWETETVPHRKKEKDKSNLRSMIAALTMCDENGKLLFTPDDTEALGEKNAAALDRIVDIAFELNHFTQSDVEELEKK